MAVKNPTRHFRVGKELLMAGKRICRVVSIEPKTVQITIQITMLKTFLIILQTLQLVILQTLQKTNPSATTCRSPFSASDSPAGSGSFLSTSASAEWRIVSRFPWRP